METLPAALAPLAQYKQFILYKLVPRDDGKTDKFPVDHRTGRMFIKGDGWQVDPAAWTDFDNAKNMAVLFGLDVGFFFTRDDPFFFLDIDNAWQDEAWSVLSQSLCARFNGAAVEVSQSGTGLHIFGTGTCPDHGCRNQLLGLELYTESRFVALTGYTAVGDAGLDCTAALGGLVTEMFPPSETSKADWSTEPDPEWSGPESDDELIALMLRSKPGGAAVFGGGATIKDLWEANDDVLATAYPDGGGTRAYGASEADAALCLHLAFWTGKNCERIERLFARSALVREKWTDRENYRVPTILGAVGICQNVYSNSKRVETGEPPVPLAAVPSPVLSHETPTLREGFQYLAATQQIELFEGCVYIQEAHSVFIPDGGVLKPDQFRATYGGYVFALDNENSKTTKSAWEAFTESQGVRFPKAHGVCFRPEISPGTVVAEEGKTYVNTYVPIVVDRVAGDAGPFLGLMAKLLPVVADRDILMSYMAACVQHPGVKFQWAPLLQGMEGNGKTLVITCVSKAVGERYSHFPNAQDIGNKFNAWILGKLFFGIEEIFVGHKDEIMDALKPIITNKRIDIQGKSANQKTGDNRANAILSSNFKEGVRKTATDRRFCPLYTAQQEAGDLEKWGMDGLYFPNLVKWLETGGYAIVTDYLFKYVIPEALNPATLCHRAPQSSSTDEAIALSLGSIEQDIAEAIGEGRHGFCGGWISSMALDRLLDQRRSGARVPPNRRKAMLAALGYVPHPNLQDGRTSSVIPTEGGKPRLYVRVGSAAAAILKGVDIAAAYTQAQDINGVASPVGPVQQEETK